MSTDWLKSSSSAYQTNILRLNDVDCIEIHINRQDNNLSIEMNKWMDQIVDVMQEVVLISIGWSNK
jgi:hypothetical protein